MLPALPVAAPKPVKSKNHVSHDGQEGEDGQPKKKLRPAVRVLTQLPCVGLGDKKSDFGNQFEWRMKMAAPANDYSLHEIDERFSKYRNKLRFAQHFAIPFEVESYAKTLPSDRGTMRYARDNASKLLFTLMHTNERSALDMNHGVVADTVLPQFHSDRTSCRMLNGPMAGVVGLNSVSLWSVGMGSSALPRLLKDILVKLVQASRGLDKKPMHYSVTTKATSLVFEQKVVTEGRYEMKTNFGREEKALGFDIKDDMDPHLLNRIAEYRKVDLDSLVPPERNHYDKSDGLKSHDKISQENINDIFSVHVLKEIHNGLQENGEVAKVITHELRLTSRIPGTDMHLFLRQASDMIPELKNDLMCLWRENIVMLRAEGTVNTENMYSPNTAMSALYLTCPALITLAAQIFAEERGITNLEIFPRINVRDRDEVDLYKERLFEATQRNILNFDKISTEVSDIDLNARKSRNAHLPMEDYDPVMYDTRGWHFRSIAKDLLMAQREELKEMWVREAKEKGVSEHGAGVDFDEEWRKWDYIQVQDEDFYYFEALGWKPLIGGVCMRINTDFIPGRMDKNFMGWNMPILEDCSTLSALYLNIKKETRDNLDIFWKDNGPVADLRWIKSNFGKSLPMSVLRMHIALNKPPVSEEDSLWRGNNAREGAIKEMVGVVGKHEYYEHMNHAAEVCSPSELGIMQHRIFQASKKEWLQKMMRSELEHWRSSALVVEDLSSFQNSLGAEWCALTEPFFAQVQGGKTLLKREMCMDWFNLAALYNERTWYDLDLDVNLGNKHIAYGLLFAGIGLAMNNDSSSTYGFPIKLEDGGHCFEVLAFENGRSSLATIDYKSPGAGADQICQLYAMLTMVYAIYICEGDIKRLHENDWHKDTLVNTCSRMQLQVVGGCGSFRTGSDGADLTDTINKFGSFLYWTEYGKTADEATEKGLYGCIERILAHSGKGGFMDEMRWQTTQNSKQVKTQSWGAGMLMFVSCNRKEKNQPKSLFNGARMTCYSSAVSNDSGIMKNNQKFLQTSLEPRSQKKQRRERKQTFRTSKFDKDEKKNGEMGIVTRQTARQHRLYFFVLYICRRSFAYFGKGFLTCLPPWLVNSYADNSTLSSVLERMTVQVRRRHLETQTDFERNFRGPCVSANVLGMYVHAYATKAALQAMVEVRRDREGSKTVQLDEVFDNMLQAFRMVPVDISSTLSGIYSWLHNCVLDHNVMLVSCYMAHTMGLRQYCSIITMGLVMNGFHEHLSESQVQEYDSLCAFLVEVVTEPVGSSPESRTSTPNPYARLLPEEMLKWTQKDGVDGQEFSIQKFMQWFNYNDDSVKYEVKSYMQVNRDPSVSCYMMNTVDMTVRGKPEWVHARENQGRGRPVSHESSCNSASRAVMQTFADMQTSAADEFRAGEAGDAARDWQSLSEFWNMAVKGVRMPTKSSDDAKQESRDLNFKDPQLTQHFWSKVLRNTGTLDGLMQEFLTLLNVGHGESRYDILEKLMRPYLTKNKLKRKVFSTAAWKASITKNMNGHAMLSQKTFQMAAFPKRGANGDPDGVFVNLGVDVLSFLLLQAMYCQNYKKSSKGAGHSTVLHLRNNCTAAQTIVELLLHTCIPLPEVPLNGSAFGKSRTGSVIAYAPSPILGQDRSPFSFKFNEMLHSDKIDVNGEYFEANVLSQTIRKPGKWRLLPGLRRCGSAGTCSMIYLDTFISGHKDIAAPTHEGQIAPFPVESTAHMQTDFKRLMEAFSGICKTHPGNRNEWAQSMAIHAKSLTVEALRYRPLTLTHCAVKGEVPCYAWFSPSNQDDPDAAENEEEARIFLFVLKMAEDGCTITPVASTHSNTTKVSLQYELSEYEALPLTKEAAKKRIPFHLLQPTLASGLVYNPDTKTVAVRMPGTEGGEGLAIPYFLFPIVNYRTFVLLEEDEKIVEAWKDTCCEEVRLLELREIIDMYKVFVLSPSEILFFLEQHKDVSLPANVDCVIFGIDYKWEKKAAPDNTFAEFKVWGNDCRFVLSVLTGEGARQFLWCNNKAELMYALQHKDYAKDRILEKGCHLISKNFRDNLFERTFYHLEYDQKGEIVFEERVYDDVTYRQHWALYNAYKDDLRNTERSIRNGLMSDRMQELLEKRDHRQQLVDSALTKLQMIRVLRASNGVYSLKVDDIEKGNFRFTWRMWRGCVTEGTESTDAPGAPGAPSMQHRTDEASALVVGVVDRWRDQRFMHNGHYRVRVLSNEDDTQRFYENMQMDFVSLSRCMLSEGHLMYLTVDCKTYSLLRFMYPGFSVHEDSDQQETHEQLLEPNSQCVVQFECYYILNDSRSEDPLQMGMRLLLPVSRKVDGRVLHYSDSRDNQLIVYANVYYEGKLRVGPKPLNPESCVVHRTFVVSDEDDVEGEESDCETVPGCTPVWD